MPAPLAPASDRSFRVPAAADQVVIAHNPKAGRKHRALMIDSLIAALRAARFDVHVETDLNALAENCHAWQAQGRLRAVVAAGGDGTVGAIINRVDPAVPLAILPLGTENLLAKHLGWTKGWKWTADAICGGAGRRIDAGRAHDRWFTLMFSAGLDAEVIHRLSEQRTGHIHHGSYFRPIVESCRKFTYPIFRITPLASDGMAIGPAATARWVQVVNVPRYALGLRFVREASDEDGLGHVCTFSGGGFWTTLGYYLTTLIERHRTWCDYRIWTARRVRIETDIPARYQLDGDPGGHLPVDVEIVPDRLGLLAP